MKLFSFGRSKPAEPQKPLIIDASDANFAVQVLERSHKIPVLVDFWAAWCAPCRMLGPQLEKLAVEKDSPFVLVKLDTEANRKSAARYNIRSIPAVKLFRNGHVVAEFTGALPSSQIRRFMAEAIEKPVPTPKVKVTGGAARRLQQARSHLAKGRGFQAFVLLDDFPEGPEAEEASALLPLARFLFDMNDGDGLTGNRELDSLHLSALEALEARQPEEAVAALQAARNVAESPLTEQAMSGLLALLGADHPLSRAQGVDGS